ncbi:MAG: hypothetical protein ACI848_001483, partial [Roseivirga sp.]
PTRAICNLLAFARSTLFFDKDGRSTLLTVAIKLNSCFFMNTNLRNK